MFKKQGNFIKKPTDLPNIPSPQFTATEIKEHFQAPADELKETVNKLVDDLNGENWVDRTKIAPGSVGGEELDPDLFNQPKTEFEVQAKFQQHDEQLEQNTTDITDVKGKIDSHGIIKLGLYAGYNSPSDPVYSGEDKFYKNIAIGGYALQKAKSAFNNIALGWNALDSHENGEHYNIGIGNETLFKTKKSVEDTDAFLATRNIAIGMNGMRFNEKGYQNIAVGRNSLQTTVNGNKNTALGVNAMSGSGPLDLTGQIANVTPSDASENVAIGFDALSMNEANRNTAIGNNSLKSNVKATNLTALGYNSLKNLQSDVAPTGTKKITLNKSGNYTWSGNIITIDLPTHGLSNGYKVSLSLDSGTDVKSKEKNIYTISNATENTFDITVPANNNTIGIYSIDWYSDNTSPESGANNITAVGAYALENGKAGENNTGVGSYSLRNATGTNNTAIGGLAATNLTTGYNNTALGYNALRYMQDGTNATDIANSTGIGFNSRVSANNQVQLGGTGQTTYAYGAVQDRSDMRDKADIKDTSLGLDFINKLRPVDFKWDYRDDYIEIDEETGEVVKHEKDGSKKRTRYHHGLIAQELKQVIEETGVDFGGFQDHTINGGNDVLSIGYTELIAPLIKAVQELSARVQELESK